MAILTCITLGTVKSFAYAPPKTNENVSVKKVKFKNRIDITVVGNLYTPKNLVEYLLLKDLYPQLLK